MYFLYLYLRANVARGWWNCVAHLVLYCTVENGLIQHPGADIITCRSVLVFPKGGLCNITKVFYLIYSYSNLNNPVTFHRKILALAGIWTRDLPGTKLICYQLSYPGLDNVWKIISGHSWVKAFYRPQILLFKNKFWSKK